MTTQTINQQLLGGPSAYSYTRAFSPFPVYIYLNNEFLFSRTQVTLWNPPPQQLFNRHPPTKLFDQLGVVVRVLDEAQCLSPVQRLYLVVPLLHPSFRLLDLLLP
jgi:hypothetical protein